jgi:rhomboid protease GluP
MFRQKTGSVVCASCGSLVGVNDPTCYTCGRRNPGLWGFGPALRRFGDDLGFVNLILYGCIAMYFLSLVLTMMLGGNILGGGMFGMLGPNGQVNLVLGSAGAVPVFGYGRWWALLTAGWLHAGALHILFNMMWVRDLGPVVAEMYGAARMVIIYTIGCIAGFLLSSLLGFYAPFIPFFGGSQYTVGASAPIFGLLGALVHYGRRGGSSLVGSTALNYAIMMGIIGFIPGMGIDNSAHLGGFVGGYLASMWLDPLKQERMDHFVIAAVCLGLTLLGLLYYAGTAIAQLLVGR